MAPRPLQRPDYRQHLEVETPEHVVLDLEIAGIGSRVLAALVDNAILVALSAAAVLLIAVASGYGLLPAGGWVVAALLLSGFALWTGYFILYEGLRRGQTPGKRRIGIRVVRETGRPATLGDAAVRNLLRLADFFPPPYLTGLLLMALHPRGKRLGDLVAGTVVVRDRPYDERAETPPDPRRPVALPPAPVLDDAAFVLLEGFAERGPALAPAARERLAVRLAPRIAGPLPPAGGSVADALAALYRRERERRRGPLAGRLGVVDRFLARQTHRWGEFRTLAERA
ncbi:MAG TPA: RDD family protein, partial [Gemmatimonadales bacterium]|nr:RDD family protein [Gemmatimonadales bacterium]